MVSFMGLKWIPSSFLIFELSAFQGMLTLFRINLLENNLFTIGPTTIKSHFGRAFLGNGYLSPYLFLHKLDHPHNLYPSLHITFSVLTAFAMFDQTNSKWFHLFLVLWITLICFSVVLVHQHHLFDVITGLLLSLIVIKFIYKKILAMRS